MDRNLQAFLAVARTKTLTQASDMIGLTQPSVTKRIANLEIELGAALFERHRRGMILTSAGGLLFERAKRIESEYMKGQEEISVISAAGIAALRVGAGPLFHLSCVAELFSTLKSQFKNLNLELSTDEQSIEIRKLIRYELDVYLGIINPAYLDDSIYVKYVTDVEHGIVMHPDNPSAGMAKVDPSAFSNYHWVIYTVDLETERTIQAACFSEGTNAHAIDVRTTSFATGLQLVRRGNFLMSAPLQLAPMIESEGLVIRPTWLGLPKRPAGVHIRKSALGYPAIKSLLDFFNDVDLARQHSKRRLTDIP